MNYLTLSSASLHFVRVTRKTCWTFVRLRTGDGRIGEGEATLTGREGALVAAAEDLVPLALSQAAPHHPGAFAECHTPDTIQDAAIVSAVDQALWSLYAEVRGRSLAQALGERRDRIPVYANINRRTDDRSPEGFAASARAAIEAGHVAFKVAPFDEVGPEVCLRGGGVQAMEPGLARVTAVREAVGPQARLMLDCHWRFDEATARTLIEAAARLGVHWIETPLPESASNIAALVRLRRRCNALGIRQAGLETSVGWETMRPFCEAGAYDVVMPDMKYIGGVREMQRTTAECEALGVQVSPHNPSGPICHAASLQVAASLEAFDMLELQFDESAMFDSLVGAPFARVSDGHAELPPGPGLGVKLVDAVLECNVDRPSREWRRLGT
ncbi:MAG: mandelate racemase/muconate lactonizing enzyme family protein [Gammaproteobacteria bacterium]|nr:mandelate racemase/muconate lactonizing enzyme family protein [Gammaproteobacteria bacterium]MYK44820.1 mandelate racemase/muconate lactonizing enzyme family protein [Gammaproteobacteria bacterium]